MPPGKRGFEKGHKLTPKNAANTKGGLVGAARNNGSSAHRARRTMAAQLQKDYCPEFISLYWGELAMGRDPRVTLAGMDPSTAKRPVGAPKVAGLVEQLPTIAESANAMAQIQIRRDGSPGAYKDVLQELKSNFASAQAGMDRAAFQKLPREERMRLAEFARQLAKTRAGAVEEEEEEKNEDASVIDASSTEVPRLESGTNADEAEDLLDEHGDEDDESGSEE